MRLSAGYILILISSILISACGEVNNGSVFIVEVFTGTKDNANKTELFAVNSDGSEVKLSGDLTVGGNVIDVAVSPNGQFVAYIADQELNDSFELFVVPVGGGAVIKLSGTSASGGNGNINVGSQNTAINWSPDSRSVAYVASQDIIGLSELFVSAVDGSSNIKVSGSQTTGSVGVGVSDDIYWSPNGVFIAYSAEQDVNGLKEIFVSTPDGLINRKMSGVMVGGVGAGAESGQIFWSPDSNFIAYSAHQEDVNILELFVSTPDGLLKNKVSGAMVVGGNVTISPAPFWSPDSSQITYLADQNNVGQFELFRGSSVGFLGQLSGVPAGGGSANVNTTSIQYSPDSTAILYLSDQDNVFNELFVNAADGKNNNKISASVNNGGAGIMQAAWSPDGTKIAYAASLDASGPKLFVVSPDGSANTSLTTNVPNGISTIDSLEWSPDGTKIAYIYSDTNPLTSAQLNIADVTSESSLVVTNTMSTPVLDSRNVLTYKWSADSSRLTFISHDDSANTPELFSFQSAIVEKLSGSLSTDGSIGAFF